MAQEERLRELALWMFVNSECVYGVRPWIVTHEKDFWFTHNRGTGTLYVIVKGKERWKYGEWRDLVLRSVKATGRTTASVLGQNDKALEYRPAVTPQTTFRQTDDGLHIRAMLAQRLYNDRAWPNPVVIRLTHVEPAFVPPQVETLNVRWNSASGEVELRGSLKSADDGGRIGLTAQYRDITGLDANERLENWVSVPGPFRTGAGEFTIGFGGPKAGRTYEIRTVAGHPLLEVYGNALRLSVP